MDEVIVKRKSKDNTIGLIDLVDNNLKDVFVPLDRPDGLGYGYGGKPDKIVLITGSARGIGKSIAELFHNEGATVIITDILDNIGSELSKRLKNRNEYYHLNVKNENEWIQLTELIKEKYNKLDVLINNAGITGFLETDGPFDGGNVDLDSHNPSQKSL
jgi:hypothetical protein